MGLDEGALQAALDAVVPPKLAGLVAGPGLGEPVVLADLLDVAMLGAGDRRAVVSVWALEAFEAVLPRVVAASVLLGRVPGGELNWVTGDHGVSGLRAAIWVDGSFEAFTLEVLRPLVALIAARGGVSPRVLWANAGHIVEAFVGMLEREAGVSAGSAAVRCLLAQPMVSGGAERAVRTGALRRSETDQTCLLPPVSRAVLADLSDLPVAGRASRTATVIASVIDGRPTGCPRSDIRACRRSCASWPRPSPGSLPDRRSSACRSRRGKRPRPCRPRRS